MYNDSKCTPAQKFNKHCSVFFCRWWRCRRQVAALPEEDLNYIARTTAISRDQVEVGLWWQGLYSLLTQTLLLTKIICTDDSVKSYPNYIITILAACRLNSRNSFIFILMEKYRRWDQSTCCWGSLTIIWTDWLFWSVWVGGLICIPCIICLSLASCDALEAVWESSENF